MKTTDEIVSLFLSIDEPYAAGLFRAPEKGWFYRHCCAYAEWFRSLNPASYEPGDLLYPRKNRQWGGKTYAAYAQYAHTWMVRFDLLETKSKEAADLLRPVWEASHMPGGWLHGSPGYTRIVREGLESYRTRILKRPEGEEFREGLLLLLDGIENYLARSIAYLREAGAPKELISAMERVPFAPARTYYEGLVAWNLIFYLDGCDNLGCIDAGLSPLYRGEDLTHVIAQLFENIDAVDMWSCTLGPVCTPVTEQALRAADGRRRPLLELRVDENTPAHIWKLAAESLLKGNCNPSFYNDRGIHDMLRERFPAERMPDSDLRSFCGGGCTETNLEGLTRAGGTDDNVSLAYIFEQYLYENLERCATFDAFLDGLCERTVKETNEMLDRLAERYFYMAEYLPSPMRTLFFDDCIEKGLDYNAGGARYTWTMNSDSGLINVIDSLSAVRKLVYEEKRYAPKEFLALLRAEDEGFYRALKSCPCFGTDDARTDALARDYTERVYRPYRDKKPVGFIDAFFLTEHQFLRYDYEGKRVGPTPDGRHAGDPTCDSVAALRGKAVKGPTAMLRSASKLPQNMAEGISVLNLTVSSRVCADPVRFRALIEGYFRMGGIQVQVTVTSRELLDDAMAHPEKHADLVVRVGGYSEYFGRLSPALRRAVYERNVHEMN